MTNLTPWCLWRVPRVGLAVGTAALCSCLWQADAQITLQDGDSTAKIDPTSQAGMFHWDVANLNQLQQQWFWYDSGAGTKSIDTIGAPTIALTGLNEAKITYANAGFSVAVDYTLTGGTVAGGHAKADIGESIKILNLTAAPLLFHFYQYSYFNLGSASADTVQLGQNLMGEYNEALQRNPTVALSETVTTPGAQEGEVAPVGGTLAKLNGGGPVTLGPPFFAGPIGPGAVTWALQWDFNIAPGGSALISKDKYLDVTIVPEPASLAIVGAGLLALTLVKRRRLG